MNKASEILAEVVRRGVAPILKREGFNKGGLRFQRRLNGVIQMIGFQLSHGNFADQGRFYINVGVGFDTLWATESGGIPERIKEYQCHLHRRIEQLIPDTPPCWLVSAATDLDGLSQELTERMTLLMLELGRMNSIEAVLQGDWLQIGNDRILRGRLFYAMGDLQSSMNELGAAADFFADRQGASLSDLVQNYNLIALEPLL